MPKISRSKEEIAEVRERILIEAISLITDLGFNNFSMRKLATRLHMTAANIYNYYKNRDELYLDIQTRGFEMLYETFEEIELSEKDPIQCLKKYISAYFAFSFEHKEYYDIMFSRNTPKYTDYIGTELEPIAFKEKETALKVSAITVKIILKAAEKRRRVSQEEAEYITISTWTSLHGIASLYNSRVLQEVVTDSDKFIKKFSEELIEKFL